MNLEDALKDHIEMVEIWAVHSGDSERCSGTPRWWFRDKQLAVDTAVGKGWCGGVAPVSKHTAIIVGESIYVLRSPVAAVFGGPEDEEQRRSGALKKLTESEKTLLGLSNN